MPARKRLETLRNTPKAPPKVDEPKKPSTRRRDGTTSNTSDRPRLLGTHVTEAAYRQFGMLAAEQGVNKNVALREAINMWFRAKNKPDVA